MAMMLQCGVVKQGIAGLMDMLMAQGNASTESKFLSLELHNRYRSPSRTHLQATSEIRLLDTVAARPCR